MPTGTELSASGERRPVDDKRDVDLLQVGFSTGRSSLSYNSRRLTPSFCIGRAFRTSNFSQMASFSSARLKNVR